MDFSNIKGIKMTQKERLVELLKRSHYGNRSVVGLADYLLDNGVIVPSCKVGDVVYGIWWPEGRISEEKILSFLYDSGDHLSWFLTNSTSEFSDKQIGVSYFYTREEAKRALKERNDENSV